MSFGKKLIDKLKNFWTVKEPEAREEFNFRIVEIDGKPVYVEDGFFERVGKEVGLLEIRDEKSSWQFIGSTSPPCIKHISPAYDYSGYAEAARAEIWAMLTAGIRVKTQITKYSKEKYAPPKWLKKQSDTRGDYDIVIVHTTPDNYSTYLNERKYFIGRFFWETDYLPKAFVYGANRMNEIWAGDEKRAAQYKEAGVTVPIKVIPHPVLLFESSTVEPMEVPHANNGTYIFYSIFQWTDRKNPEALFRAYWDTFDEKDNVILVVKTYCGDFSESEQMKIITDIRRWQRRTKRAYHPPVILCLGYMTDAQLRALHAAGDCFVCPSRGEGLGIPLAQAIGCKNAVIYSNSGGVTEYLPQMLPHKEVPVFGMNWIEWYGPDQNWIDVDQKALGAKMREHYENPKLGFVKSVYLEKIIKEKFDPRNVGALIKKRFAEIYDNELRVGR